MNWPLWPQMCTKLVYQQESYKKEHDATVVSCRPLDSKPGSFHIICDETIFYPQGGGQPTDTGSMASTSRPHICCDVKFVSYDRATGIVSHEAEMKQDDSCFKSDELVRMNVDWEQRYLHMRLHSGGHLIDHAVQFLECPFRALKASHFPSGPAVEFQVLDTVAFPTNRASLDKFIVTLQAKCDELLAKDMPILVFEDDALDSTPSVAATHEQKLGELKTSIVRMVLFEGCPAAVPCGGTHVARAGEIGRVLIKKVTYKDASLRISYRIE